MAGGPFKVFLALLIIPVYLFIHTRNTYVMGLWTSDPVTQSENFAKYFSQLIVMTFTATFICVFKE